MQEESGLESSTMAFLTRKRFLPIVIVVVTPPVITRETVIANLRTGTATRTISCAPSFPPSSFYLHASKKGVSAMSTTHERSHERVWHKLNRTRYITSGGLRTRSSVEVLFSLRDCQGHPPIGPRLHSGVDVALHPRHTWPSGDSS